MPTQIFSLRIMDDDDDDDGVRKQIDGAFPLSLLRLPTHRPSILSNSRRRRHRISVVLNGAEDFFQRVVVFRVFSTSIIVLCLWRFFHFFHSPKIRAIDLFGIFLMSIFSRQNLHFFGHFVCARDEIFLIFFFFSPLFSNFFCLL